MRKYFVFIVALALAAGSTAARAQAAHRDTSRVLEVAVAGTPPFVMDSVTGGGISMEIFQTMAAQHGWRYHLHYYPDVPSGVTAVEQGAVDMLVGPVSITADRARLVSFTQPYYYSGISILSRAEAPTLFQRIRPFFTERFFWALCVFLLILAGVGTLLWLAEYKKNPDQFPPEMTRGIANGMWCAIVTMSTTGYGDRSPVSFWGRVIAASWMVISIIFATTMVAGIASTLTLSGLSTGVISKANQLRDKKVAVVKGSPAQLFLERYGAKNTYIDNLEEGYTLLKARKVDAVFYDRPQLLYFLQDHGEDDLSVSVADYVRRGYGFAVPLESRLLRRLNLGLLDMQASGETERIIDGWLGTRER